jgi:hypothetical protein
MQSGSQKYEDHYKFYKYIRINILLNAFRNPMLHQYYIFVT